MTSQQSPSARARRQQAEEMLAAGRPVPEVAAALGVGRATIYRWRRQREGRPSSPRRPRGRARVERMLQQEGPEVARVLLDMAKGGDVRAASLVVRLLGSALGAEEPDDSHSEAALRELERELRALPAHLASEVVGLLATAEARAAGTGGGPGAPARGRARRSRRLPWQPDDHPSDEGSDSL